MRWLLTVLVTIALFAPTVTALEPEIPVLPATFFHPRPRPARPPLLPLDCPPGTLPPNGTPGVPDTNPNPNPTDGQPATPPVSDPGARPSEGGTLSAATFNSNLFGDQLSGSARSTLARRVVLTVERNGARSPDEFARYLGIVNTRLYVPHPEFPADFAPSAQVTLEGLRVRVGSPIFLSTNVISATPGIVTKNPLFENAAVTAPLAALFPRGSVVYIGGTATEMDDGRLFTPHRIDLTYDVTQVGLSLPLPPDGGKVGRTKLSDDNSPLPQDRVIFNYDYYSNAVLADGLNVHRFAFGLEKTFLDRRASFEFRIPFASTLDNVAGAGGTASRDVEFGNLFTALKGLVYRSDTFNASTGFALSLPMGADSHLMAFDGRELVRVKNRSVLLAPFVAALYTPGERFFSQAWLQGSFDLSSNPVLLDFDKAGLRQAGTLKDQARMSADVQIGYWVYRRTSGDGLRGVAPFFELHFNTTLTDAQQVAVPPRTVIGSSDKRFDEMNASIGVTTVIGSNLTVMTGLVVPLREGDNRFFDYQLGVRANWFYGPTSRAREESSSASARSSSLLARADDSPDYTPDFSPEIVTASLTDGPIHESAIVAPSPDTQPVAGFFGDLIGISGRTPAGSSRFGQLPVLPKYNGIKPTDHDGPRLSDRYYFSANHASDVNGSVNPPGSPTLRLDRQIIGVEATFGDRFGAGLRLPFLQLGGTSDADTRDVGDLTAVFKYAVVNDPCSGNAVTLGLNITFPTGGRGGNLGQSEDGRPLPRAVFVQPWVGAIWNAGDLFFQGTSAVLLPTDPVYPAALFNSFGTGYWLYKDGSMAFLRGIAPVIEVHANTPITNRGSDNPLVFRDQVNITSGLFIQFTRLSIGGAVSVPLVGPRPFDVEGIFTASYQF